MIAVGTYEQLVEVVRERGGFADYDSAEPVVAIALQALSHSAPEDALRSAAERLPAHAAEHLLRHACAAAPSEPLELYREVAEREGVSLGFGLEHTQVVCEVLAELLEGEPGAGLRAALPTLFRSRERVPSVVHETTRPGHSNLAEGRPGSSHPLCESPPIKRVLDHDKNTLARGRPRIARPLSEGGPKR